MDSPVWTWQPITDNPADMCLIVNVQTGEQFKIYDCYSAVSLCRYLNDCADRKEATRKAASSIRLLIAMLEDFRDALLTIVSR